MGRGGCGFRLIAHLPTTSGRLAANRSTLFSCRKERLERGADEDELHDARWLLYLQAFAKRFDIAAGAAGMLQREMKRVLPAPVSTDVRGGVTCGELFQLLEREDEGQIEGGEVRWRGNGRQI